jgi:sugar/nucleoside kinase (ribokinase family)
VFLTMEADCKNELLQFLKQKIDEVHAVVMPDFFYDRLINLDYDVARFSSVIADKTYRKGGSIDGIAQIDLRGGNAINTASALVSLGVNVTPIVCTNKLGLQQIKFYLRKYSVDFSHIKITKKPSLTTALEFKMENSKANVMLRDLGALASFNPSDLTDSDYELIKNADYVCLFNWAGTKKYGTILAENVFRRVKTKGKGKTYYDPADPTPNRDKIPELIDNILTTNQVDVLSLNENEAICYAAILNGEIHEKQKKQRFEELALEAARILVKYFSARIDLHTTLFSATLTKKKEVIVPAFKIKALRATGAGDAWNAGNILGDTNILSEECRLALANAVSAYYLSNLDGAHPTRRKLVKFVERSSLNSLSETI